MFDVPPWVKILFIEILENPSITLTQQQGAQQSHLHYPLLKAKLNYFISLQNINQQINRIYCIKWGTSRFSLFLCLSDIISRSVHLDVITRGGTLSPL